MATMEQVREVEAVSRQIYELMAGRAAGIQGAICADLLSCWLAGHIVPGNEQATANAREAILKAHIETVRRLIPIQEREILGRHGQQ